MAAYQPDAEEALNDKIIEELRRHYDSVCDSFKGLRTKALAMLGGEVAVVTFLFSATSSHAFLPKVIYGAIFLLLAILLMAIAFLVFLSVLAPSSWSHPPDTSKTRRISMNFHGSPKEFQEYLIEEYNDTIERCIGIVGLRSGRYTLGIYALSLGTFILVMLKYGGGTIKL